MPSDMRLLQEQYEVIQGQLRHQHEILHAVAKTQITHGKILREILKDSMQDGAALTAANAELEQATAGLQAAIDAQKPPD